MRFHDSPDESALGLAAVGILVVTMAALLGHITGNIQPVGPGEYRPQQVEQSPAAKGIK